MNFEIRKTTGKEEYQFFLVDGNQRILSSNTFETREACTDAIRSLINSGGNVSNYNVVQDGNDYFATVYSSDGSPLALSKAYASATGAETLRQRLITEVFDDREFEVTFITTKRKTRKASETIEMYDLSYKSKDKKGFDTYKKGKIFYFAFNNDNGETIMYGRAQKTGTKRQSDIWYLITKASKEENYEIKQVDGGYYYIFNDRKGNELARSVIFANEGMANSSISTIKTSAPNYKAEFSTAGKETKARKPRKKSGPNDDYDFTQKSKSGVYGFEAFKNEANKGNYFHFNDDNGDAVLYSQNYSSSKSRDNGIRSVIQNGVIESRYAKKTTKDGLHYFIIRAGNNQEVARSRTFTSLAAMETFMLSMRTKVIGFAETYGLEKDVILSSIVTEKETFTLERTAEEVAAEAAANANIDEYLSCAAYKGHERLEAHPDFVTFDHDGESYFAMIDGNGEVVLRSEGYTTTGARDNGIQSVIKNIDVDGRKKVIEEDGNYFMILKAGNHQEIGRSCPKDSEAAALALMSPVAYAVASAGNIDEYLPCADYKGHERLEAHPDFVTFDHDGESYFAMVDGNGEVVLRSEGYTTTGARDNGIQSVIKNIDVDGRKKVIEEDGNYFMILKAGNHQEIGRSCPKDSEAAALALMSPVAYAVASAGNIDEYLPCADYKGHPRSVEYPEFSTFEHQGEHYFALLNDENEVVLRSEGYTTTSARDNGIRSVIKNKDIEERRSVVEEDGYYFIVLKAGNHQEIGRSCPKEEEGMAWGLFAPVAALAAIPVITAPEPEPEPVAEVSVDKEDDYLPCKIYEGRKVNDRNNNVALFKYEGQFYFALYNEDGSVKLRSEGFTTSQNRDKELSGVLRHSKNPDMYERIEKGKYYMNVLRDENGTEVGRSCLRKEEDELVAAAIIPPVVVPPVVEPEPVVGIKEVAAAAVVTTAAAAFANPPVVEEEEEEEVVPVAAAAAAGGSGCMRWWWLLPLLLLLLLLLWFLLRGCAGCAGDGAAAVDGDTNVIAPPPATETPAETVVVPDAYNIMDYCSSDPTNLGFKANSAVGQMAACIADPNCAIPSKKYELSIVHFGDNDAHMNKAAYAEMDDLAKLMKSCSNLKLEIHGHIDDQESDVYNGRYQDGSGITLSQIRARCVYRKMTDRGISGSRMTFKGYGSTQPKVSNNSNDNRIQNRRVEVIITQK